MAQMPANVRISAQFPFPATVQGAAPITLTKLNGVWTVGLNVAGLGVQVPPAGNYPTDYLIVYDAVANTIFRMALSALSFAASAISFTPTGGISSINVQSALAEVDAEKAAISSLASVAFSGAGVDMLTNGIAWTPVLTFVTPGDLAVAYSSQFGRYWQLSSNLLLVQFNIVTSAFTFTTASGNLKITGLPFTTQNTGGLVPRGGLTFGGITKAGYTQFASGIGVNTNFFIINCSGSAQAPAIVTAADTPTAGTVTLIGEVIIFL